VRRRRILFALVSGKKKNKKTKQKADNHINSQIGQVQEAVNPPYPTGPYWTANPPCYMSTIEELCLCLCMQLTTRGPIVGPQIAAMPWRKR
jgi:hypothetical protein